MTYFERLQQMKMGLLEKESGAKPKKPIPKKSAKKIASEKQEREQRQVTGGIGEGKGSSEQWRWFEQIRPLMTGICAHCGEKSEKNNDAYFHFSIAHILEKRFFKSVATNENNWVELCHFSNSCHSNFDNHMIDLIELNCFDQVIEKFAKMYPAIAPEEKKRIPQILLQYLEIEK